MSKKGRRTNVSAEWEEFTAQYMKALNEKFKLRSQLAALNNDLEDIRANQERITDHIQDLLHEEPVVAPPPPTVAQPSNLKPPKPSPPQTEPETPVIETKPETPPEVVPVVIPKPYGTSVSVQVSLPPPQQAPPSVVTPAASPQQQCTKRTTPNSESLSSELERLQYRYNEITFYATMIIFTLFALLFVKDVRALCPKPLAKHSVDGKKGPACMVDDVELQVRLEDHTSGKPAGQTRITLSPAPPCDKPGNLPTPSLPMECGSAAKREPKYDCEFCNSLLENNPIPQVVS